MLKGLYSSRRTFLARSSITVFSFPANSYNFHEASCWKAQSSRRIGNFIRHLLMHECVSGDERPKNEIEYYANVNGRASSSQCCMRQGHGRVMPALNLSVITRKNRSAKGRRAKYRHLRRECPRTSDRIIRRRHFIKHLLTQSLPGSSFSTRLPICKRELP